jgi:membrane protein YdbS with pleckstrin-like domain
VIAPASRPAVLGEPSRRLAPAARWVWRGEQLLGWGVAVALGFAAAVPLSGALAVLARTLPVAGLLICVVAVPELRWRHWRWEVRPEAIDIRRGALTVRRTLVPMLRVQHVDTTRDIVEQQLGLASVRVHTAAGSHTIPLLPLADADEVRERIAALARTADEA